MKSKRIILFMLLVLLLTACNEPNATDGNDPPVVDPEHTPIENNLNTEPDDPENNQNDLEDEQIEEQGEENENDNENGQHSFDRWDTDVEYYMNPIFDIKPINEETDSQVVLLTFDDGPKEAPMVEEMLEILDKHEAKAIFFVNGYRVEQNPELLEQIWEAGHPIGNHSWDHINLSNQTDETIRNQIQDVQQIVEDLTGELPKFFRPPHGAGNNDYLRDLVRSEGMLQMNWSNGSLDWETNDPDAVIEAVMEQLRPGSNILMHELSWTIEALDELLTQITEAGYSFVDPYAIQIEAEETDPSQ